MKRNVKCNEGKHPEIGNTGDIEYDKEMTIFVPILTSFFFGNSRSHKEIVIEEVGFRICIILSICYY